MSVKSAQKEAIEMTEVETSPLHKAVASTANSASPQPPAQTEPLLEPSQFTGAVQEAVAKESTKDDGDNQDDDDDFDAMKIKDVMRILEHISGAGQSGKVWRFSVNFVSRSHLPPITGTHEPCWHPDEA